MALEAVAPNVVGPKQSGDLGKFIGRRVAEEMERQGLRQEVLAERAGVSQTAISDLVGGRTKNPRVDGLLAIATALAVDVRSLIPGPDDAAMPRPKTGDGKGSRLRANPATRAVGESLAELWDAHGALESHLATMFEILAARLPGLTESEVEQLRRALASIEAAQRSRAS
jgi:transcriptional regulator with XRE-family HTH domain